MVALKQSWAGCCFCNAAPPCSRLIVSSTSVSCPAAHLSHGTFGCWHSPAFFLSSVWSLLTAFTLLESSSAPMLGFAVSLITIDYKPKISGVHGDSSTLLSSCAIFRFSCLSLLLHQQSPSHTYLLCIPPVGLHPSCFFPDYLFNFYFFPWVCTSYTMPVTLDYRQKEQIALQCWPGNKIPKETLLFYLTSHSSTLQDLSLAICVRSPRMFIKNDNQMWS